MPNVVASNDVLDPVTPATEAGSVDQAPRPQPAGQGLGGQMLTAYHAKYFAHELTRRRSSDSLEKFSWPLADAQVDLNPHQVDAALFAFRSPLSRGAILADEVGLGKTIEAGILLSQKWAEQKRRLLVIVPANLRKQWHQELADKFFLPAAIMETRSFDAYAEDPDSANPFDQPENIIICSYQFARSKEAHIKRVPWDLVVIDEAHRLRNVHRPGNLIAKAIKDAVACAPKVLLTATPLQNSLIELFGLVSIIDDHTFGDLESFKAQFSDLSTDDGFAALRARLRPVCQRTLRKQVLEYVPFTNRYALVQEFYPTEDERRLYDLVSGYLQRPELFALPAGQRALMTLVLRKLLASSTYAISGTLEALAAKLQSIAEGQAAPAMEPEGLAAEFEALVEIKDEWDGSTGGAEGGGKTQYTPQEMERLRSELATLREFNGLARSIRDNSKGVALVAALRRGFEEAQGKGAQRKAVIFTESTRTQLYLREVLEATEYRGRIVLFNGSNADARSKEIYRAWALKHGQSGRATGSPSAGMRAALVDCFRDEAEIMIATEAAAEGMNLQFCSLVVNYDLPWNPQRIEQRIGRCHRYGQKCDVVVVNFLNKENAADQRVYELLDEKFKLFDGVFGASDEVLGSLESGVDIERRIADIYQRCRTPQEVALHFDELQSELDGPISDRMQRTREELLATLDDEVTKKLRLGKSQIQEFLGRYETWLWLITEYCLNGYARFEDSADGAPARSFVLEKDPFPGEATQLGRYRIGRTGEDASLYRLGHPLAQRIISECRTLPTPEADLTFAYTASGKRIRVLAGLKGKSGWLRLDHLSLTALDAQDYLLFSAVTDEGEPLDQHACQRLFTIPAFEAKPLGSTSEDGQKDRLSQLFEEQKQQIIKRLDEKNMQFLEHEGHKLHRWGEDRRSSMRKAVDGIEAEMKDARRHARAASTLPEKGRWNERWHSLEGKREQAFSKFFKAAKGVDAQREQMIEHLRTRLKQHIAQRTLFTVRWYVT
jgi:hypothetical protein